VDQGGLVGVEGSRFASRSTVRAREGSHDTTTNGSRGTSSSVLHHIQNRKSELQKPRHHYATRHVTAVRHVTAPWMAFNSRNDGLISDNFAACPKSHVAEA
jgi:hypothetical protein